MTRLKWGIVAVASLFSTVVANAQPAPVYNWTGFYVGASAGWQSNKSDWTFLTPANSPTAAAYRFDDAVFGVHAGAQYQMQQWVFGVETALLANVNPNRRQSVNCFFPAPFDDRCDQHASRGMVTVGGRVGYSPMSWDRLLIFGSGGAAFSEIRTSIRFGGVGVPPPVNATPVTNSATNTTGYYVGGGFEYALSRMWWIGAEYQRVEFNTEGQCNNSDCATASILNRNVKSRVDLARVRLSLRPM